MKLITAIAARVAAIHPQINISQLGSATAPDQLSCHIHVIEPGRFVADITGPSFIEASDAAVPVIDALFSTDVATSDSSRSDSQMSPSKTRVGYAHGYILRDAENHPIGYRCVFNYAVSMESSIRTVPEPTIAEAA